jgi:uncharacterized protein (TIGR03000 family)
MYSVVLATMMATTPAAPDWHGHGCYGGNAFSCYGCCGYTSCYGCCGYTSCYGCCGYASCYGCCGSYVPYYGCCGSCHGCWGYSCWGGYNSALYSYYPSCCGTVIVVPPAVVPEKPKLPKPKDDKDKKDEVSLVTIKAPSGTSITVDGLPLKLSGTTETFETPKLDKGRDYSYVFRAEAQRDGKTVVRERKVTVRAGETTQVDFTDLFAKAVAHVTIVLPADAKLIVDNVSFADGGTKRRFDTPDLEPGRRYTYTMRAEVTRDGRLQKQEKQVDVEAGKDVVVEFKELPALQAAQR